MNFICLYWGNLAKIYISSMKSVIHFCDTHQFTSVLCYWFSQLNPVQTKSFQFITLCVALNFCRVISVNLTVIQSKRVYSIAIRVEFEGLTNTKRDKDLLTSNHGKEQFGDNQIQESQREQSNGQGHRWAIQPRWTIWCGSANERRKICISTSICVGHIFKDVVKYIA